MAAVPVPATETTAVAVVATAVVFCCFDDVVKVVCCDDDVAGSVVQQPRNVRFRWSRETCFLQRSVEN